MRRLQRIRPAGDFALHVENPCMDRPQRFILTRQMVQHRATFSSAFWLISKSLRAPMLATHWDGHPTSLGRDLLNCDKSVSAVIEVAKAHTIDAADPQMFEALNRERVEQMAQKHQLSVKQIKAGKRRGNVICADDHEIADIRTHRDLVEFPFLSFSGNLSWGNLLYRTSRAATHAGGRQRVMMTSCRARPWPTMDRGHGNSHHP
jgi:hypothetical protein